MISCDAIRVVRVTNLSNNTIEIKTDFPHKIIMEKDSNDVYKENLILEKDINLIRKGHENIQIDTISENLIIRLQPFQYFDLAGHLGPPLVKIKTWDLNHSRLSIYTLTDTIIAKNKDEILDLFDNQETKYIRKFDKNTIKMNNKYWKNIVIRK
jgi:hypothetical protein